MLASGNLAEEFGALEFSEKNGMIAAAVNARELVVLADFDKTY